MKKSLKLVPALRFPEFDGVWKTTKLKEITKINQGLQIPIAKRYREKVENSYFYITNEFLKENSDKKYFIKAPSDSVKCIEEDILMTRTGNTGKVVTGVNGAFHNNFFKIKYDKKVVARWFLYYFLTSYSTQCTILKLAGTSTIPDLNHGDFYAIKLTLPPLPEQKKIATFLTSIDQRINLLTKKVAALQAYKKGIMQKIFKQEIRFRQDNGESYPEWEERCLGELATPIKETGVSNIVLSISAGSGFVQQQKRFNKVIAGTSLKKYTLIQKNDFSYNRGNSKMFKYGCIYRLDSYNEALVPFVYRSFRLKTGIAEFYEQFFKAKKIDRQLRRIISSSARMDGLLNINEKDFYKATIIQPVLLEQSKIAVFLHSLDQKIILEKKKLTKTQVYKKGLLQQLFC